MSEEAAPYTTRQRGMSIEEIKSATEKYTAWRPFMIRTRDGREYAFTDSKSFRPTANFRVIYYMGSESNFPEAIDFFEITEICDCPASTMRVDGPFQQSLSAEELPSVTASSPWKKAARRGRSADSKGKQLKT